METPKPVLISELEERIAGEVVLSRTGSIAVEIERLLQATQASIDAALYRFNSRRLARALDAAQERGVRVRLAIDRNKYEQSSATRQLLPKERFSYRLTYGRDGAGSKMHHKFVLLDQSVLLTGSYNWTFASEERNYENLLVLREAKIIDAYHQEFETLWSEAEEAHPGEGAG
jgi:phosphatidylserine/phosphatidylglycerophosphate/cardiolipin synthase-like enzyme